MYDNRFRTINDEDFISKDSVGINLSLSQGIHLLRNKDVLIFKNKSLQILIHSNYLNQNQ